MSKVEYKVGTKVKVLTVATDNKGTVTYTEPLGSFSSLDARFYEMKHWVRLENGTLLKDVLYSELEEE